MRVKFAAVSIAVCVMVVSGFAQAKRDSRRPSKPSTTKTSKTGARPDPTPPPTSSAGAKKNERPASTANTRPAAPGSPVMRGNEVYRYEFSQPAFTVSHILIEHDETGAGRIEFQKNGQADSISEPLSVSSSTLERLKNAFTDLDFLNSSEDYQFERDFSNMGNIEITLKRGERQRAAKYNWTSNKSAKLLMDEYRRIANQAIWIFDFNLARENQPLETPKLIDSFDGMLKRNELADPHQMLPFLIAVSNDERVPLIGRNRAGKIVKQLEK